jgi:endoglucanase
LVAPSRRAARLLASLVAALVLMGALGALAAAAAAAGERPALRVRNNTLVDGPGGGHVVRLLGVDRSGLEYACIEGWGFFDSPHPFSIDNAAMIAAMKSWDIDAVRVPLNEDCWLGLFTKHGLGGAPYRRIVERYVRALNRAGLYVILDLHWAGAGDVKADGQTPMADALHAPAFWRSVASTFKRDHALVFDLFNEPYGISWSCWLHGCLVPGSGAMPAYRSAGTQQLVDAVRSAGATQPLMLGGLEYAYDLSGWLAHEPRDPLHQLVASEHNYGGLAPCGGSCRAAILATHRRVPVVFGELGETDCGQTYIDAMMKFADAHGISYLGWAWDAVSPGGWSCTGGPSLISSYAGTPTAYGIGLRDHLRMLAANR